jgi:hypothetical protein
MLVLLCCYISYNFAKGKKLCEHFKQPNSLYILIEHLFFTHIFDIIH